MTIPIHIHRKNPLTATSMPITDADERRISGFNKKEFCKLLSTRFGVTLEEGALFYEEIGQRISQSLGGGETAFLFGQGTLKVVKKRGNTTERRVRYRPSTRTEKNGTVAIEGLPGIVAGIITDVVLIGSISAGERALQIDRACAADGPGGKLVIYKDDNNKYRGVFTTECAAPLETIMDTKRAAKTWLRETFPATVIKS